MEYTGKISAEISASNIIQIVGFKERMFFLIYIVLQYTC